MVLVVFLDQDDFAYWGSCIGMGSSFEVSLESPTEPQTLLSHHEKEF